MLSKRHVRHALQAKADSFRQYQARADEQRHDVQAHLRAFEAMSLEEIEALFALLGGLPTGIRPTSERVAGKPVTRTFPHVWGNHVESHRWAMDTLRDVPVAAVDGSQIANSPDLSPPVGAIQVGWFVNPHRGADDEQDYIKDIRFEVLSPPDLIPQGSAVLYQGMVDLLRFEAECDVVCQLLSGGGIPQEGLVIFDGSFAISFAEHLRPSIRRRYIGSVRRVLRTSLETGVPVAAYVDTSHATDLVRGLALLATASVPTHMDDAQLLQSVMTRWGDRSEAMITDRNDGLFGDHPELAYYDDLALTYLKTTSENPPSRVEVPRWVLEGGRLDQVINLLLAECIVQANGYPYAVETVDALAVISGSDREEFYRVFRQFGGEIGIPVRYSRKAASKRGRR